MSENLLDILGEDEMFLIEDAEMASQISDDDLQSVQDLGNRQLKLERQLEQLDEVTKKVKEAMRRISDDLLPKQMMKAGVSSFKLLTGEEISMDTVIAANMPKADDPIYPKAIGWLDEAGLGDIIKKDVIAKFGRGEAEKAQRIFDEINRLTNGETPLEMKESVHYQTLNSTLRARVKKGESLPTEEDGFSIYYGPRTKIKKAKK